MYLFYYVLAFSNVHIDNTYCSNWLEYPTHLQLHVVACLSQIPNYQVKLLSSPNSWTIDTHIRYITLRGNYNSHAGVFCYQENLNFVFVLIFKQFSLVNIFINCKNIKKKQKRKKKIMYSSILSYTVCFL